MPEWGVDWEALGASSQRAWRLRCEGDWEIVRSELEVREIPAAREQCEQGLVDLIALRTGDSAGSDTCDVLRAVYLADAD